MERAKVTVGLYVRNDGAGLRRSVPTVFGQTWHGQLRLIVVDDGSTDETPALLAALASAHDGLDVVRNEQSEGRPAARNKITQLVGSEYLAWIDAGDLWHPRKLEVQVNALLEAEREQPDAALLCVGSLRMGFAGYGDEGTSVPDVDGDQLYNALNGTLLPDLQGVVGRAHHFRSVGGFDSRLRCREDFDFLVKFLLEGGRVVRSLEDISVCTCSNPDPATSAKEIAADASVLLNEHRPYYGRYRNLARRARSRHYKAAAQLHRYGGARIRSLGYVALANLATPIEFGRKVARRLNLLRVARSTARLPVKALRPFLPALQRTEVLDLARQAGAFKVAARLGLTQRIVTNMMSEVEETSGSSPYPALMSGELPAQVQGIEQDIKEAATHVRPEMWLRLEAAYRRHGLLHSAELALRRGMREHPASVELRIRLAELLSLRQKWADCVALWSNLGDARPRDLRGLTHARVARSFREIGEFQRAHRIAAEGARRWPEDFHITEELYASRAGLTDWKHAVSASGRDADAPGAISDLGFLSGADQPIRGKIGTHGSRTVTLVVNGVHVASTHAASGDSNENAAYFSLSCAELLRYLGDGDTVWAENDGKRLAIAQGGTTLTVETGYPSRMRDLERKLAIGYVFTKRGALRMGNTPRRRKHTLALFDEVSALIADSDGYSTYPFYGHLLGAIREHNFIEHDAGGFDMAYVSRLSAPDEVRTEFMAILRMLLARGYHLRLEPWSTYVRTIRTSRVFVDLNYAWFNSGGALNFSFGWRHQPVTDQAAFFTPRESVIGSRLIRVPGNAEDVLEQMYGPTWAVPDQGFVLEEDVRRDERYLLTVEEMRSIERLDPDRVVALYDRHPDFGQLAHSAGGYR